MMKQANRTKRSTVRIVSAFFVSITAVVVLTPLGANGSPQSSSARAGWERLPAPAPALAYLTDVQVGIDDRGDVVSAWAGSGAQFNRKGGMAIYDPRSKRWTARQQLLPGPDAIDLAVAGTGATLVVWRSGSQLFARFGDAPKRRWSRRVRLENRASSFDFDADINGRGLAVVAWTRREATGSTVVAVQGKRRSGWAVSRAVSPPGEPYGSVRVAIGAANESFVAWTRCLAPDRARCLAPDRDDDLSDANRSLEITMRQAEAAAWRQPHEIARGGQAHANALARDLFDIAVGRDGTAAAAWVSGIASVPSEGILKGGRIGARVAQRRQEWGAREDVLAARDVINYFPTVEIAINARGVLIAGLSRFAFRNHASGRWAALSEVRAELFRGPAIALAKDGSTVAGWTDVRNKPAHVARVGVREGRRWAPARVLERGG